MSRECRAAVAVALALLGCSKSPAPERGVADVGAAPPDQEPPVALNGDSPIQYPPRLYEQKVEGDVVLRLYVDSMGRLAAESSRVAESSGYPSLDSAALSGSRRLRFAPARRHGLAIATAFLQSIEFRHPQASTAVQKGEPDSASARPTPPPRNRRRAPVPVPSATTSAPAPSVAPATSLPSAPAPPPGRPLRRDTASVRRDTTSVRRDTVRPRPDSVRAAPESTRTNREPNAPSH